MSTFKDLLTAANTIEESNLHKNEKIPEVIAAFKKCYDLDPSNKETKRKYLSYFKRQFELEHIKKNQEELKVLGNAQVQQGRYEEAVIIYDACIDLDPSIESAAPIYSNRSLAFFNLGRFQEAEDDACMAIILKPEFARGYLRRGNAAMKLEKWKESSEAFEKYFELDPENAKSDPDVVKNKNSMKKAFEQSEAETRRHERLIEKTRAEILAIKDEEKRSHKLKYLLVQQLADGKSFDVDVFRVLVECGADLSPVRLDQQQMILQRMLDPTSKGPEIGSPLMSLLSRRLTESPKVLRQLDELIFFVIDEMLRRNVPFDGRELCLACNRCNVGPVNPKILRVLLETNKFDVNQSFAQFKASPLMSLVVGMIGCVEMPPEAPDCLHFLLNWKGIDVNAVSRPRTPDTSELEVVALGLVRHPEVAKILIRYGANVNAVFGWGTSGANVLDLLVLSRFGNADHEELIRLLIGAGARLLPNGRDGKSSETMLRILGGAIDLETKKTTFFSEEVLQMILQLNLHQGLLFRWQDAATLEDLPFLLIAIVKGAPRRFVELLCGMTPEPMKTTGINHDGRVVSVGDALPVRIATEKSNFEESLQVLGVLLEYGFDLFGVTAVFGATSAFALLWISCRQAKQDLNLLKKTIIEKRSEEEFQRCLKTLE